jgi:predicted nucleic acid-binding protein
LVVTEAWLIDKSVLVRMPSHPDEPLWSQRVDRGLVHICSVTLLQLGYSARTAVDHAQLLRTSPLSRMIVQWDLPVAVTRRAYEVQGLLATAGRHRAPSGRAGAPSGSDLLVAAVAEALGLTVLHCDKDYELIAEVTGQPQSRLS